MKNKKVIGIIAVIAIIIVAVTFGIMKMKSKGGVSVNKNQTLRIKNSKSDFSVKFESINQENVKGDILSYDTTYTILKLSITNNSDSESKMYPLTDFILLDSKNNEIKGANIMFNTIQLNGNIDKNTLLPDTLNAKQTINGCIYFETDSKDIAKLQIRTPSKSSVKGEDIDITYEDYFINLK